MTSFGITLRDFVWIFVAGGLGSCSRVALAGFADRALAERLPYGGTLLVNILGCIAIGFLGTAIPPGAVRPVVLAGFLGGFTTYSAFGLLSWELASQGRWPIFAAQVVAHLLGGLLGVAVGVALASPFLRSR